jgi:hypothetical protein
MTPVLMIPPLSVVRPPTDIPATDALIVPELMMLPVRVPVPVLSPATSIPVLPTQIMPLLMIFPVSVVPCTDMPKPLGAVICPLFSTLPESVPTDMPIP